MPCFANVNLWKCSQWICHAVSAVGTGTRCPELLQARCLLRCLHSSSRQCNSAPTSVPGQQSTSFHHSLLKEGIGLLVGQDLGGSEMSSCLPESHSYWRPEQIAQVWLMPSALPTAPHQLPCAKSPPYEEYEIFLFFWGTSGTKVKLIHTSL